MWSSLLIFLYFVYLSPLMRNDLRFETLFFSSFFQIIILVFVFIKTMQKINWNILWSRNIIISSIKAISIFNFRPFYQKLLSDLLNLNISPIHCSSISLRMAASDFFFDWDKILRMLDLCLTALVKIASSISISSHEFSWELVFKFNSEFSIKELPCWCEYLLLLIFQSYILYY